MLRFDQITHRAASPLAILMALVVSAPANAQTPGLRGSYAGIDYVHTSVTYEDVPVSVSPPVFVNGSQFYEDTVTGFNLHVGTRLHPMFGVELGYVWFPEHDKDLGGGNTTVIRAQGASLDGMVYLALDEQRAFELIGLGGVAFTEATAHRNGPMFGGAVSETDPDWSWRAGVGTQYRVSERLNFRGLVIYQPVNFDSEVDHVVSIHVGANYLFE
jgi:opacity protein-like surface antigen